MRFYGWIISDNSKSGHINSLINWSILGFILWNEVSNKFQLGYLYGLNSEDQEKK